MSKSQLPKGWAVASNNDLGEFINGVAFKPQDWGSEGTPIIRIQNLTDPNRPYNYTHRVVDERYVVDHGDILVSWSATLDVYKWDGPTAYVNQHIFKVVPSSSLDNGFVFFALKESINELTKSEHLHGTTMKHVNRKPFLAHPVWLPPLYEQRRIVERIQTLFARIDKGEEALREVQALIKRYRQSVLKAAVTGELTRDWREANQQRLEPAPDLLADLTSETAVRPILDQMPNLPANWGWARLDTLCTEGPTNGTSPKSDDTGRGVKSFKLTATTSGEFVVDANTIKYVQGEFAPDSKYWLKRGDILIQRGNTIDYVGTAAGFPGPDNEFIYPDLMMRVRIQDPWLAEWVVTWINSYFAKQYFKRNATGTAGNMPKINGKTLKALAVPIPPSAEIRALLEVIERYSSKAKQLEMRVARELRRTAALRRSILKSAFSGQLVPQDLNDEPASELLARIRADREATPRSRLRRKAARNKAASPKAGTGA